MNIKRLLAALMAATMLFGLAACGGGSDDAAASAPAASAPAASGEAAKPAEVKKDFTNTALVNYYGALNGLAQTDATTHVVADPAATIKEYNDMIWHLPTLTRK